MHRLRESTRTGLRAPAYRWIPALGWFPIDHAQLAIMHLGELFLIDPDEVPTVQQELRESWDRAGCRPIGVRPVAVTYEAERTGSPPLRFLTPYDAMAALIDTESEADVYVDDGHGLREALLHSDSEGSWSAVK